MWVTDGTRTRDPQDHNLMLCQLSYDHHAAGPKCRPRRPRPRCGFLAVRRQVPLRTPAKLSCVDDDVRISSSVTIPAAELQWSFMAAGGPGGQHANTSNTAAELRFDTETSVAFSDSQRARVIDKLGSAIRIVARDERSQLRNRDLAISRLVSMLVEALRVPTVRRKTKPSKRAVQRRLTAKAQTSERKSSRRLRGIDE